MSPVHCTINGANTCGFESRVKEQRTPCEHSILLQTASNGTSGHRMMCNTLNLLFYGSVCVCAIHHRYASNPPVITGSGATKWV
ncbi:hypothetical protein TNCV_4077211 [Trichonephila clavipes]|nr:hypothetical protein TNCV_4077211 [Trichonephila clavipes]